MTPRAGLKHLPHGVWLLRMDLMNRGETICWYLIERDADGERFLIHSHGASGEPTAGGQLRGHYLWLPVPRALADAAYMRHMHQSDKHRWAKHYAPMLWDELLKLSDDPT